MGLEVITDLSRAVSFHRLHGKDSSTTAAALKQLHEAVKSALAGKEHLTFALGDGLAIVDGDVIANAPVSVSWLNTVLENHNISSITLRDGVGLEELRRLVQFLAIDPGQGELGEAPHITLKKLSGLRVSSGSLGLAGGFDVPVALDALSRMISKLDPDTRARLQAEGLAGQKLTAESLRTLPSRVKALFVAEALLRNVPSALMSSVVAAGGAPTDLMNDVVPEILARIADPKQRAEMIGRAIAVMARGIQSPTDGRRAPRKTIGVMVSGTEAARVVEALCKKYDISSWPASSRTDLVEFAAKKALTAVVVDEESVGDMESFFEEFRYRTKEETRKISAQGPLPVVMITQRTVLDLPPVVMGYPSLELVPPDAPIERVAATIGLGPNDLRAQEPTLQVHADRLELQQAREVVSRLLPRELPNIPGLEMAAYYEPALQVGGDYYDVIQLPDNAYGLAVADVSGKGVPGALVMTTLRSVLRMVAAKSCHPKETLAVVNDLMGQSLVTGMFISIVYAVYESQARLLRLVSSGHTPVLVQHKSIPQPEFLDIAGMILGVVDGPTYAATLREVTLNLYDGDLIVLYTDGVTEAMNKRCEVFGEQRLADVVSKHHGVSANQMVRALVDAIETHRAGAEPSDDTCILVLRVK